MIFEDIVFDSGRRLEHVAATGSTNDDVKDCPDRLVCEVTLRQTEGRGRLGRSFHSEGGMYFSLDYPLTGEEKYISLLTLLAGLAVSQAIEDVCGVNNSIKWPNDILGQDGRKLCGILTELTDVDGSLRAVSGIGINLWQTRDMFPAEIRDKAASLTMEGAKDIDAPALLAGVVNKLDRYVLDLGCLSGENEEVTALLNSRSCTVGHRVACSVGTEEFEADALAVLADGSLIVRRKGGTDERIISGEVKLV